MVGWIGRVLSNFGSTVAVGTAPGDREATFQLSSEARAAFNAANFSKTDIYDYALELGIDMAFAHGVHENPAIVTALVKAIEPLVISNAIMPPDVDWGRLDFEGEQGFSLRAYLERHKRYHQNFNINDQRFRAGLEELFGTVLSRLPHLQNDEAGDKGFGIELGDLLPDHQSVADTLVRVCFNPDYQDAQLFEELRYNIEGNICSVSGIAQHNIPQNVHRLRMPRDYSGSRQDLFDAYLNYTPFREFLRTPLPFKIPDKARFEHTHIVGGTGHGKTQLLSHFILRDIVDIFLGNKKSMVVIDSQGDLIRKISSMLLFDPASDNGMQEKLVIIDPQDLEFPTALNIFHINEDRLAQYGAIERERVFNGAVELYEHFFAGLLGAEMTQKQGVAFTYLARLMLEMPDATIHTLRDLMDDPHQFKDQIAKLSGSSRMFFEREFLTKSFDQTRRQISRRLWGVLAIPAFERMFGQTEHKVDLFDLLNEGKIILINTSQALLKKEGSAIFGKFFLAAISQAISERAVLPEDQRTDTIIYLDEAHECADGSLEVLLNQGRKYRAGVVIAHQFLDQLNGITRQTLLSNASVKIVGGLAHKDSQSFAREMGTDSEFLSSLVKHESSTEFGLWIKHVIPQALRMKVPFGLLEQAARLDGPGEQRQLEYNRHFYGASRALPKPDDVLEPEAPTQGRGGTQHREIQQLIKSFGHEFGFGAQIEAQCQNSDGAIDVLLTGEKTSFAIEVSITTSVEHEIGNLRKCLSEAVDYVLCVSPNDQHRADIQNAALEVLPQTKRLKFLKPQAVKDYLEQFDERESTTIRGYAVMVKTAPVDPEDLAYREMRIRRLLNG